MSRQVLVDEIFGPVIQGEGPMCGRPTIFVRTGGCDYRCTWCDSMHAVDPANQHKWARLTQAEIVAQVQQLAGDQPPGLWITLSGGNPAIWDLSDLVDLLHAAGFLVTMETQGSHLPTWAGKLDYCVVSPKPPSSGEIPDLGTLALWNDALAGQVGVKVVVAKQADLDFAGDVRARLLASTAGMVLEPGEAARPILYLQPCNPHVGQDGGVRDVDRLDLLHRYQLLAQDVMDLGWHDVAVLPQLHVLATGGGRGR